MWVPSLGREDPLKKGMETHSNIVTWRIPWTEESDGLQFIGSQRVGHERLSTQHTQLSHLPITFLSLWTILLTLFLPYFMSFLFIFS